MAEKVAFELTADPVPIEQAFKRAGVAGQGFHDKMQAEITKETGLINTLSIRLERLKTARDSSNDPTKIQRINQLISEQQTRYNSLTESVKKQGSSFVSQLKLIGAAVVAGFSIQAVQQFYSHVETATVKVDSFRRQLSGITGSEKEAGVQMQYITRLAEDMGIEVGSLTQAFISFQGAFTLAGGSLTQGQDIFKSVTEATTAFGLSADQTQGVLWALGQMVNKGKVYTEELLQIAERLPGTFTLAAQALGVTGGELNKMLQTGQVMTSDFLPKFSKQLNEVFSDRAIGGAKGYTAEINRAENAYTELYTTIGETGVVLGSTKAITASIKALTAMINILRVGNEEYIRSIQITKTATANATAIESVVSQLRESGNTDAQIGLKLNSLFNKSLEKEWELRKQLAELRTPEGSQGKSGQQIVREASDLERLIKQESDYNQTLIGRIKSTVTGAKAKALEAEKTGELTKEEKALVKARQEAIQQQEKLNKLVREWMLDSERASEVVSTATVPDWAKGMGKSREELNRENAIAAAKELQESADAERVIFASLMSDLNHMRAMDEISESEYLQAKLELEEQYAQDVKKTHEDIYQHGKKLDEQELQEKIEKARLIGDTALTLSGLITNAYDAESIQLQKQKEQGIISEEQYQQKLSEIKRKQFEADRIAAIAQIAINTAIAVASAANLSTAGALTPFIIGLAAANALVVATRPNPYAEGIKRVRGGQRGRDSVPFIDGDGSPALLMPGEMIVPERKVNQHSSYLDNMFDGKISPTQSRWASDLFVHNRIDPGLMRYVVSKSSDSGSSRRNSNKELKQLIKAVKNKPVPSFSRDADRIVNAIHSSRWRKYNSNN